MVVLDFVRRASPVELRRMLILTVVAGVANALLVMVVNRVAGMVAVGIRPGLVAAAVFVVSFAVYWQCNRMALLHANRTIEKLLKNLRLQVIDKLRQSELEVADGIGRGHLFSLVSQETNHLSMAFPLMVDCFQQAVLLSVSLIYLAYLSQAAFAVFLLAVGIGIVGYRRINRDFHAPMQQAVARQGRMLDAVGDIVDGVKELRLNARRSEAVRRAFETTSALVEESRAAAGEHWASMIVLSSIVTYFMLGVVVLVLPGVIASQHAVMFQLIPTLLFCMGPLAKIVAQSPLFVQAETGLQAILDVGRRLDEAGAISPAEARTAAPIWQGFSAIDYRGIRLARHDADGSPSFTLGPLDFTLQRGETVFLVGGNGSGKSTALRLFTGLLRPDTGEIRVDGALMQGRAVAGFRELFSAIFADFHLFDRLYGLEHVDPRRVQRLLAEMDLAHKVSFTDGRFSDIALSTGQRKRLGLVAALLEDRPILVFDEWSAEQDGTFRDYFYTTILDRLRLAGKTCVVVTHDERYYHRADRVIVLELGKISTERPGVRMADQ